jgi:hypothetical protein
MKLADVRRNAFAMPLTDTAYPPGPYKFYNREFVVITYRTDPDRLREVVPAFGSGRRYGRLRIYPHGLDRLWRLHRDRSGDSGVLQGQGWRGAGKLLCPRDVSR